MTTKLLTKAEFAAAIQRLSIGEQATEIAEGVLVHGMSQSVFVKLHGLTKGAVSQTVNRVWRAAEESNLPHGFERVTAVLPEHQAFVVKRWAADAKGKMATAEVSDRKQRLKNARKVDSK